jgi:hypothetical protein
MGFASVYRSLIVIFERVRRPRHAPSSCVPPGRGTVVLARFERMGVAAVIITGLARLPAAGTWPISTCRYLARRGLNVVVKRKTFERTSTPTSSTALMRGRVISPV